MANRSKSFPYELLMVTSKGGEAGKECKRLERGLWSSHVPLPVVGDKINEIGLDGVFVVRARLITKHGDEILMISLYVERFPLAGQMMEQLSRVKTSSPPPWWL